MNLSSRGRGRVKSSLGSIFSQLAHVRFIIVCDRIWISVLLGDDHLHHNTLSSTLFSNWLLIVGVIFVIFQGSCRITERLLMFNTGFLMLLLLPLAISSRSKISRDAIPLCGTWKPFIVCVKRVSQSAPNCLTFFLGDGRERGDVGSFVGLLDITWPLFARNYFWCWNYSCSQYWAYILIIPSDIIIGRLHEIVTTCW